MAPAGSVAGVARYREPFLVAAAIGPGHDVLDVGCGTGETTREAARLSGTGAVIGVDLSLRMLDLARACGSRCPPARTPPPRRGWCWGWSAPRSTSSTSPRGAAREAVRATVGEHLGPDGVTYRSTMWMVTARR